MKEIATADELHDRRRSPALEANTAAVGDHLGILSGMIEEYVEMGNHGKANKVAYDTDSSDGTRHDRGRRKQESDHPAPLSRQLPIHVPLPLALGTHPPRCRNSKHRDRSRGRDRGKDKDKTKRKNKKNDFPHCAAVDPPHLKTHPSLAQSK